MNKIEELRKQVVSDLRESNPHVFERAAKNRALNALLPNEKFKPTIKNLKEEILMSNNLRPTPPVPPAPPVNAGIPTPPAQPQGVMVPQAEGTGISARMGGEIVRLALKTSTKFRPKSIIVDKDSAAKMVVDMQAPDIVQTVQAFKNNPENTKMTAKGPELAKYSDIRALKDTCIRTGKDPLTYAKKNSEGVIETTQHKPVVQGIVVTFPATEGQGEITSIIKKAEFFNEIASKGGGQVVGTLDESVLDTSKFEIPVVLQIKPYQKKTKDGKTVSTERLTGVVSKTRKEQWFSEMRTVSLLNMFLKFPIEGYDLGRVIPRKLHKTVTVGNQQVAVIELNEVLDKEKPKRLPKYDVVANTLTEGTPGYEISNALGIDAETIEASFTAQRASAGITNAETTDELIEAVIADFRKNAKSPEYGKILAQLEAQQNFDL